MSVRLAAGQTEEGQNATDFFLDKARTKSACKCKADTFSCLAAIHILTLE